jgi:queuine tRNA-ribosyltransferase/7-cyano-7-deazaguanine tRNA-ribosyltransferase
MSPKYKIIKAEKSSKARAGIISTVHGDILTPAFFPVGTQGTVKALSPRELKEIGIQGLLGNTYHLHLRPGEDSIAKFGGLAKWTGWNGPTMTDSGGFQVFSLGIGLEKPGVKFLKTGAEVASKNFLGLASLHLPSFENFESSPRPRLNKITEEGVTFQSHIDGSTHKLTPESSIKIQEKLGADLIIAFDDLESPSYDHKRTKESLELTNRWELRSKKAHKSRNQLLYGVTHGGKFKDLRIESAKFVDKNFDAVALGGAHSSKKNLYEVIEWTVENISEEKPRHLLGIGEVEDTFEAIERGIDTFDCVIPTRLGRMGHVFISPSIGSTKNRFRYDITKSVFAKDKKPIDPNCDCYVCQNFTRAYVNHLFRARELLAYNLATYHNVYFLNNLVSQIRNSILNKNFAKLKRAWIDN